jgi:hypothetical protein
VLPAFMVPTHQRAVAEQGAELTSDRLFRILLQRCGAVGCFGLVAPLLLCVSRGLLEY